MPSPALTSEIKALLVSELNLSGRDPATIADDAPLFGEGGLGLDSLDALIAQQNRAARVARIDADTT
ncbi:MAG: hypothetical protein J0I07_18475, partial [Myxococcales bacterium]|nr:hypothetical protein [Myxococcales bacterium]